MSNGWLPSHRVIRTSLVRAARPRFCAWRQCTRNPLAPNWAKNSHPRPERIKQGMVLDDSIILLAARLELSSWSRCAIWKKATWSNHCQCIGWAFSKITQNWNFDTLQLCIHLPKRDHRNLWCFSATEMGTTRNHATKYNLHFLSHRNLCALQVSGVTSWLSALTVLGRKALQLCCCSHSCQHLQ